MCALNWSVARIILSCTVSKTSTFVNISHLHATELLPVIAMKSLYDLPGYTAFVSWNANCTPHCILCNQHSC